MKRNILKEFARHALSCTERGELVALPDCKGEAPSWFPAFKVFADFQASLVRGELTGKSISVRRIFSRKGNIKLKFLSFSSMPGLDCPGAGKCLKFCYSFKGWRYPAPFFRQLRNALIMRFAFHLIEGELARIMELPAMAKQEQVDFRLFVDGDFPSVEILASWMTLIESQPRLAAYGYSKSWAEFVKHDANTGGHWPENYQLNLSSGSLHNENSGITRAVKGLACVRGEFLVIGHKSKGLEYNTPEYRNEAWRVARETGIKRPFVCPGKCNDCLPKGKHACGSKTMKAPVVILAH